MINAVPIKSSILREPKFMPLKKVMLGLDPSELYIICNVMRCNAILNV